jgi:hypothetical protein
MEFGILGLDDGMAGFSVWGGKWGYEKGAEILSVDNWVKAS